MINRPVLQKVPSELVKEYGVLQPILNQATKEIENIIKHELARIGGNHLIRTRLTECRVKSLPSIWRKALKNNLNAAQALKKTDDLVGIRIVCSNLEDVNRVRDCVLSVKPIELVQGSKDDKIDKPSEAGYRALHFNIKYPIKSDGKTYFITAEIQIRTLLQDSWAVLVHRDIYKEGKRLPKSIKRLSSRLSDLLRVADDIAQDIREQAAMPLSAKGRPSGEISEASVAFIYKRIFGTDPKNYFVQYILRLCERLGVTRLDAVEKSLRSSSTKKKIKTTYKKATGWDISDELIFETTIQAIVNGEKNALKALRFKAYQEYKEIDQKYKSELQSDMPNTIGELIECFSPSSKDDMERCPRILMRCAEFFDSYHDCGLCATPLIDEYEFADRAVKYYKIPAKKEDNYRDQIIAGLQSSGLASSFNGSLCDYCEGQLSSGD